jgi:ubiquinone/menaquinone biosynthesis C-methylase UbiE
MDTKEQEHWDRVYSSKAEDEVSWFQSYPRTSMQFVESFGLPLSANIIDIGGGDSQFANALLEKGYRNIYVLDISSAAIERAKKRLGERSLQVTWIVSDITAFQPPVKFDFWHDRATFHFLTSEDKINQYLSIAADATRKNGYLVLGTFSENGPQKCSGLPIKQYTETSLPARFKPSFEKLKCFNEDHLTPSGSVQNFLFCSFKRK